MSEVTTKTQEALKLWKEGLHIEALRIFKTFKMGFSTEEKETIQIAYEMQTGKDSFYESLGYDKQKIIILASDIINSKYDQQ